MSEMALTADHLIVIGRGRVLADTSMTDFIAQASSEIVRVSSPDGLRLRRQVLAGPGVTLTSVRPGQFEVQGRTAAEIGRLVADQGLVLHGLVAVGASLRGGFHGIDQGTVDFHAGNQTSISTTRRAA